MLWASALAPGFAQYLWYRAYQDGVRAYNAGDQATAQSKLLESLSNRSAPTARGRSVLYYGQLRGEFLPEYYLALVAAKAGRWNDALKYAAAAQNYVRQGDPQYQLLMTARGDAERALN